MDESLKDMEQRLGYAGEVRRDLAGRGFAEKQAILRREGVTLLATGEAIDGDGNAVSLLEADREKPEPEPEPVELTEEDQQTIVSAGAREFVANLQADILRGML